VKGLFGNALNTENWLAPSATSTTCCSACESEHEPNCNCKDCERARWLKTPEGKKEQKRQEAERKRELKLKAPLDRATWGLENAKESLSAKKREDDMLQSDIREIRNTTNSLLIKLKGLEEKARQTEGQLPQLEKALAAANKSVEREKVKYERKKKRRKSPGMVLASPTDTKEKKIRAPWRR